MFLASLDGQMVDDSQYMMMSGALQGDEERVKEEEGPVWPTGYPNYLPPMLSLLGYTRVTGDYESDATEEEDSNASRESDASEVDDSDASHCETQAAMHKSGLRKTAKKLLAWHEWQTEYLKAGYGSPEDPGAKHLSDLALINPVKDTSEATTKWRQERLQWHEESIAAMKKKAAHLEAGNEVVAAGASSNPESAPLSKSAKRRLERKRAKAKQAEQALEPRD